MCRADAIDAGEKHNMRKPLASALAEFVCRVQFDDLPSQAVQIAKTGIIDCIGVAIAGSQEPPVRILRRAIAESNTRGEATLLGITGGLRSAAPDAAWINGTAGHVLDYDDVARGHPSVVIVPAILALAEEIDSTGTDVITAYVAGYEVWMELMQRERGSYQEKGWHHTPILGAIAATAACANLQRLGPEQTTHALGIAAAQASGIVASHGTMMKSVQVGKAAHTAVLSARLARLGITASPDVLDQERGFLKAISPAGDVDTASGAERLGRDWHICKHGLGIKRYPVCYRAHRAIDATLGLLDESEIAPKDIDRIEVSIGKLDATILLNHFPESGLAAKFSIEFAIACAVVAGNVSLQQVNDAFVRRHDVRDLMRKVTVVTNENYDPEAPGFSMHDCVRVFLKNGQIAESEKVRYARGHPKLPLTAEDLKRKFIDCVTVGNAHLDGPTLLQQLQRLEHLPSCRFLQEAHSSQTVTH